MNTSRDIVTTTDRVRNPPRRAKSTLRLRDIRQTRLSETASLAKEVLTGVTHDVKKSVDDYYQRNVGSEDVRKLEGSSNVGRQLQHIVKHVNLK